MNSIAIGTTEITTIAMMTTSKFFFTNSISPNSTPAPTQISTQAIPPITLYIAKRK